MDGIQIEDLERLKREAVRLAESEVLDSLQPFGVNEITVDVDADLIYWDKP